MPNCELCGEPMPAGEEMFRYHGYSGPCPKPPKAVEKVHEDHDAVIRLCETLRMIADIADGSRTVNSLPNIAKIARTAIGQTYDEAAYADLRAAGGIVGAP